MKQKPVKKKKAKKAKVNTSIWENRGGYLVDKDDTDYGSTSGSCRY